MPLLFGSRDELLFKLVSMLVMGTLCRGREQRRVLRVLYFRLFFRLVVFRRVLGRRGRLGNNIVIHHIYTGI